MKAMTQECRIRVCHIVTTVIILLHEKVTSNSTPGKTSTIHLHSQMSPRDIQAHLLIYGSASGNSVVNPPTLNPEEHPPASYTKARANTGKQAKLRSMLF